MYDDPEIAESDRAAQVVLYAMGTMHELEQAGLVTMYRRLSPAGLAQYERLKASGFSPTEDEIREAARFMAGGQA